MINNTAKHRMLSGQPALGTVLNLGSPTAAQLLAQTGLDFMLVDAQHGDWDDHNCLNAFRQIQLGTATPMARVCRNDFYAIGRLLDRGALGIVVPMVESAEEARQAAHAMHYPPAGGRSFGPILASYHGDDYADRIDREVFLAVQIECATAVERAEAILGVEGVDGCWIGPMDLARSMGVDVSTASGREAHRAAILRVLDACRKTGKIPGIFTADFVTARYWIERGFRFVTVSSDIGFMLSGAQESLRELGRLP